MRDGLIAMIGILLFLIVTFVLLIKKAHPRLNKSYYQKQWLSIANDPSDMERIVRADSLMDDAMKKSNIKGNTTGERLNNSEAFIKDLNSVWKVHKLRNSLVHDSKFKITDKEVKHSLYVYKKALKDLGAL